jgi:hypothetical protein
MENAEEKYCLLCRCLDERSVPLYVFKSTADFFNNHLVTATVDQACCLVQSGRVINAWMHSSVIQAKNYSSGKSDKTPYTIAAGTQNKDNAVILFRDSRASNFVIMIDMAGDASILTLKACKQLVENNCVNVLNLPTREGSKRVLSVKYLPII